LEWWVKYQPTDGSPRCTPPLLDRYKYLDDVVYDVDAVPRDNSSGRQVVQHVQHQQQQWTVRRHRRRQHRRLYQQTVSQPHDTQCLNGRTPPFLSEHCIPVSSADTRRHLRSAVIYLPCRVSGSALTAVRHSQLLARWPGTHSRILSEIQRAAQTVLGIYLKRNCLHITSASSALGVVNFYVLYKSKHSHTHTDTHTHTHTHRFNGHFTGTTWVSRYQKGKTDLDFTDATDSEWQRYQLGHMQVCTSLQTDNHDSTPTLSFLQAGCPSCRPTNTVKALWQ